MVRAVLDANVFVSAAIRPSGPPGQILVALFAREAFQLVLSPRILAETERVLRSQKLRRYIPDLREVLLLLSDAAAVADLVPDTGGVTGVCRDSTDDAVLAAAVEGRANAIVTGDDDLLSLGEYEGIVILTPRQFVEIFGG